MSEYERILNEGERELLEAELKQARDRTEALEQELTDSLAHQEPAGE